MVAISHSTVFGGRVALANVSGPVVTSEERYAPLRKAA
jgi:hypothetical protein